MPKRNSYYYTKAYMARLKEKCFQELGHVCSHCGFSDKRALDFDHVNGGGSQHRKELRSTYARLRHILDNLHEYQVLCRNCNWIAYLDSIGYVPPDVTYTPERVPGAPRKEVRDKCDTCEQIITPRRGKVCIDCKKECGRLYMREYLSSRSLTTVP
jgi:hypothetical protein